MSKYDPFEDESLIEKSEEDVEVEIEVNDEDEEEDEMGESFSPETRDKIEELINYTESLENKLERKERRLQESTEKLREAGIALVMADRIEALNESERIEVRESLLPASEFDLPSEFGEHIDSVVESVQSNSKEGSENHSEALNESSNEPESNPLGEAGNKVLGHFHRMG